MCLSPITIPDKKAPKKYITVPCGKCLECLNTQSSIWATRCMLEASHHLQNCVVTLTYDDDHVPLDGQLFYPDVQEFLQRLRSYSRVPIRYFVSGEYGCEKGRPHYHIILFGWKPSDGILKFKKNGIDYYTSKELEGLWLCGFCPFSEVSWKAVFYSAKYMQKALPCNHDVKPFVRMSLKPGIGYDSITESMIKDQHVYVNGRSYPIPRYFRKVLDELYPPDEFELRWKNPTISPSKNFEKKLQKSIDFVTEKVYTKNRR